jgi:signal transduction histidine kinase
MPYKSLLSNLIRAITQFSGFNSRLGRQLTVWVFVSIVLVELIILIPSYLNLEQELLARIDDKGRAITEFAMGRQVQNDQPSDLAILAGKLVEDDLFHGVAIQHHDGMLISTAGDLLGHEGAGELRRTGDGKTLDVHWHFPTLGSGISISARLDASFVSSELRAFLFRIGGLVLIISTTVCSVTMIVFHFLALRRLTLLRNRIREIMGEHPETELPVIDPERNDELGDVIESFNELGKRIRYHFGEALKARNDAEFANTAKSNFLANMSHELRTPMHAVLGYSDLGSKKLDSSSAAEMGSYFDHINLSGKRLLALLDDLLDLSKLEAGMMKMEFEEHDICKILDECIGNFEVMLKQKDLGISVDTSEVNCIACIDEFRIMQVFTNLLSNAIKFSPAKSQINITLSDSQLPAGRRNDDSKNIPSLSVSVADQGIGIPEDELKAVFDKFIQSSETKTDAGGTGLGLAISKEIIKGHHGTIEAKNLEAGGAEFIATLPRKHNGLISRIIESKISEA